MLEMWLLALSHYWIANHKTRPRLIKWICSHLKQQQLGIRNWSIPTQTSLLTKAIYLVLLKSFTKLVLKRRAKLWQIPRNTCTHWFSKHTRYYLNFVKYIIYYALNCLYEKESIFRNWIFLVSLLHNKYIYWY